MCIPKSESRKVVRVLLGAPQKKKTAKFESLHELFQRAVGFQGLCQHLAAVWPKLARTETAKQKEVEERRGKKTMKSAHKNKHDLESSTHCGATGCSLSNRKVRPSPLNGIGGIKAFNLRAGSPTSSKLTGGYGRGIAQIQTRWPSASPVLLSLAAREGGRHQSGTSLQF